MCEKQKMILKAILYFKPCKKNVFRLGVSVWPRASCRSKVLCWSSTHWEHFLLEKNSFYFQCKCSENQLSFKIRAQKSFLVLKKKVAFFYNINLWEAKLLNTFLSLTMKSFKLCLRMLMLFVPSSFELRSAWLSIPSPRQRLLQFLHWHHQRNSGCAYRNQQINPHNHPRKCRIIIVLSWQSGELRYSKAF